MANYDTLEYNGVERSFADWGFDRSSVQGTKHNMREDIFRATVAGANVSDDPIFPFEAQVIVRTGRASATGTAPFTGGTVKFTGDRKSVV